MSGVGMISPHHQSSSASQSSLNVYMPDPNGSSSPSRQSHRQSHTYNPQRCHTPSLGQRFSPQVSNGLSQRLDTSSRINSSKRPTSAHHTSYLGHLQTFSSNGLSLHHSNSQLSPSTALSTAASTPGASMSAMHSNIPQQVGYDSFLDQPLSLTPVQVPSHSRPSRHHPPPPHTRVQSMSGAPSGHPHPYLQPSSTYSSNNMSGDGMYAGQGQDQSPLGLNVNTMSLSSSSQNGYAVHSPAYHYQGHSTVPSSNSNLSSPLSPLSPLIPHFANSQSSSSGSPASTPSSTPATRPRAGTVGAVPHLPPSMTYPASPTRPFECDQCKLSFVRHHDLKRHKETHTGGRPHICSACGKSYTRKDALVRHQVVKQCGEGSSRKKEE